MSVERKKMRRFGTDEIPQAAFINALKMDSWGRRQATRSVMRERRSRACLSDRSGFPGVVLKRI